MSALFSHLIHRVYFGNKRTSTSSLQLSAVSAVSEWVCSAKEPSEKNWVLGSQPHAEDDPDGCPTSRQDLSVPKGTVLMALGAQQWPLKSLIFINMS